MAKQWTYHKWHKYESEEHGIISFITQLYQIGVYGIINNNSSLQGNFKPQQIIKMEKRLNKDLKKGVITNLTFGKPITVIEEDGLYKQIT